MECFSLKGRKKALQIAMEPSKSPEAPPGHVLMNPDEKTRTLGSLKRGKGSRAKTSSIAQPTFVFCSSAEADLLKKYNSLPVRTDTDFLKRKKQVLLRRLGEVDEAIKIFSRPKVYIKTDPY